MHRIALFILLAIGSILILNVTAQQIIPGQVTATVDWHNPCCYAKFGSFSPMITICNGLSETITGNVTLTISDKSNTYQRSVVYGPVDWKEYSDSGWCPNLSVSWQIPVTAPSEVYNAMISIRPTAFSPYFDPIEIQKSNAFFVTPEVTIPSIGSQNL
ncbi:MAG: hypothetical protein LUQ47_00500 [Methanotrichaceae archaeon]|nr:hypothetical protein [Methanotrichaceae archaeon]